MQGVKRQLLTVTVENVFGVVCKYHAEFFDPRTGAIDYDFEETMQGRGLSSTRKFLEHLFETFEDMKAAEVGATFPRKRQIAADIDECLDAADKALHPNAKISGRQLKQVREQLDKESRN